MKKIILLFLVLSSLAHAKCPENLFESLHDHLRASIPEITWLDINPLSSQHSSCKFLIRYYPCSEKNKLIQQFPLSVHEIAPQCVLQQMGKNKKTEGYCTIQDIHLACR